MTLPKTSQIAAGLVAMTTPALVIAGEAGDWDEARVAAASALALATIAFLAALVEHLRRETPSRWVAVFGLSPPEVVALLVVLRVFEVTHLSAGTEGAIVSLVSLGLSIFGVTIAQAKVTSPETGEKVLEENVATAQAIALRATPGGTGIPPAA